MAHAARADGHRAGRAKHGAVVRRRSPPKFTRLHLLGQKGAPVYTDWCLCKQWKYGFTNLYTSRQAEGNAESVFPAVIEPYVGEPFVTSVGLLNIEGNDADVARPWRWR